MTTELSHAKDLWKKYNDNDSVSICYWNRIKSHAGTIQRWKDFLDLIDKTIDEEIGDLVIRSPRFGYIGIKLADLNSCLDFYKKVGVIK